MLMKLLCSSPLREEENCRAKACYSDRLCSFATFKSLETEKPFEINTGVVSRGYRALPYPAPDIREYIRSKGGKFILSSDSHSTETLCFGFENEEIEKLCAN